MNNSTASDETEDEFHAIRRSGWERLLYVASEYSGYVPVREAIEHGVQRSWILRLAAEGRLDKAAHGIYRIPDWVRDPRDEYILATLWLNGKGAVVGESALEFWDLAEVNPPKISLQIFPSCRIRTKPLEVFHFPKGPRIHSKDTIFQKGVVVISPFVSIKFGNHYGVAKDQLIKAFEESRKRDLLSLEEVKTLEVLLNNG